MSLNIVRRKVELKCPAENIPNEIVVDLAGTDIGTSIKISSVKLESDVVPTISGRDFVIATVASPTVIKEPEKLQREMLRLKVQKEKLLQKVQKQQLKMAMQLKKMISLKKVLTKT